MTREEAINFLKGYLDEVVYTEKCRNAHEMAIKALEQEPCEYCIEIPEGATNGDMIKAVFPNAQIWQEGESIYMGHKYMGCPQVDMEDDWWNSPYRKEQ